LRDTNGILSLYNALGNLFTERYRILKEKPIFDSAMLYYKNSLEILKKPKYSYKSGTFLGNMGDLLAISGDYRSAKFYSEKSLKYFIAFGDSAGYFLNVANLANYNLRLGDVNKAIDQLESALRYCERNDNREVLIYVYKNLNEAYFKKGDVNKAYEYLQKSVVFNDSLNNQIYSSNIKDLQSTYQLEKKESDIKALTQANEIQELKAKQSKLLLLGVGVILLIIIVIAYLLFKRNREKNAANLLLQEQNSIITQKKQEIEHSIQYAKGIQNALLPAIKDIKSVFPEGFIYYLPKDVVSGDFYWFHKLGDLFYLVAADCTGHGVPGALMSIVSMDKLSQAMFEKKLTEPKEILRFLNIEIKNSLKQHDDETRQRDGLDLALLRINTKTNTIDFSAANRPLYIVSKGEIKEYKADKVAIAGFTPDEYVFQQVSLQLNKGDCIYLSTDGYADQFGGNESKKFMTKNFKSLLQKICELDMNSQEKELINNHLTWKGNYEQVDDILVIGIKI
jgi:serine phosphatase RsbU (regulator of sigma subunit)